MRTTLILCIPLYENKALYRMYTHSGYSFYLWASALIPLTARPLCHACDIGLLVAKQRPSPRLTAASWQHAHHNGRETFLLHLHSPGAAAALLQEQERKRESGREKEGGRESVPLRSSAVTTPARPGKESAPLTSPRRLCCPTLHLLGLYLTYQRRGTGQVWCWAGGSVTTVQGTLDAVSLLCLIDRHS